MICVRSTFGAGAARYTPPLPRGVIIGKVWELIVLCVYVCAFTDVRNYDYDNTLQQIPSLTFYQITMFTHVLVSLSVWGKKKKIRQGCHSKHKTTNPSTPTHPTFTPFSTIPYKLYFIAKDEIWCRGRAQGEKCRRVVELWRVPHI